ncbi:MAG: tetratricopeptide repeat protein [Cyanobacteria bacterium J06621_8]
MNNPAPLTPLQAALARYENALNCLSLPNSSPNQDQIIEILSARDVLGKLLETEAEIDTTILSKLIELDGDFKREAYKVTEIDLTEYRNSLPTSSQAWLLDIEKAQKSHPWNRFEWWLQGAKIVILSVNLALFSTLATRFLSGGSSFLEVALIAFPGILSLLQLRKELTGGERKRFYNSLKGFNSFPNISRLRKVAAIFMATFLSAIISNYGLLLGFLLLIWFKQPFFSNVYNKIGQIQENNQNLVLAKQKYLKAIALDSDNFDAHFKLGFLYEELQEIDKAQKEYIIAMKRGHLPAYNNLAYWYIRQDKFLDAIALLERSQDLVREQEKPENFKKLTPKEQEDFQVLKYNLAKNRGWAMLEAGQDEEAEIYLDAAIGLANATQIIPYVRNPGAAHCLYAQLLEKQAQQSASSNQIEQEWQKCQDLIQKRLAKEPINVEEYKWLHEAKQKLRNHN